MSERETRGFAYRLSDEALESYKNKPLNLRLEWLYAGNLLRKAMPDRTKKLHEYFRADNSKKT